MLKIKENALSQDFPFQAEQYENFIQIKEDIYQWTPEEWIEYIQNLPFRMFDKHKLVQQLGMKFKENLRSKIWPWIGSSTEVPFIEYDNYRKFQSKYDKIIIQDIGRTMTSLEYFKFKPKIQRKQSSLTSIDDNYLSQFYGVNQRRLFHILRAYANYDPNIGYVQGMNYVVGCILISIDDNSNPYEIEAKAFQLLLYINYKLNWRQVYSKSMKKLKSMISYLQQQIQEKFPKVYECIQKIGHPFLIYFEQLFFSIMNYKASIEFSQKVMDVFLIKGDRIIFEIILRCILFNQEEILQCNQDNLPNYLKDLVPYSVDKFGIMAILPINEILL